jgi:phosphate-selective porin OprO/OprP
MARPARSIVVVLVAVATWQGARARAGDPPMLLPPGPPPASLAGPTVHEVSSTPMTYVVPEPSGPTIHQLSARSPDAWELWGPGEGSGDKQPATKKEGDGDKQSTTKKEDTASTTRFNLREGFVGETADGDFRYHVGGRIDWDSGWYNVPQHIQQSLGDTPLLDGTDLRRLRLGIDGTMWKQLDFNLEADFSRASDFQEFQSTPQTNIFITNAWVGMHDLPLVDTVKAGHQKEYITFSNATSSKWMPFMERPYIFDAFENPFSWDNGMTTNRTYFDEHVTSWLGVFWNGTRSQAFNVGGHYAFSGRVTWMPIYDEAAQEWLNFGVSGSFRALSGNSDPDFVKVRPLVRTGQSFNVPNLIDTGTIESSNGLGIAGVGCHGAWGPWTIGSEFLCWTANNAFLNGLPNPDGTLPAGVTPAGNLFFSGFYVEVLYFLTPGDHRPVDRKLPGYARVVPESNFYCTGDGCGGCHCTGLGAWEVGIRYDHVDVNSGMVRAGELDSVTLGLNWYLNPNTHVTLNYVYTDRESSTPGGSGSFHALGVRVHFDF